jgi:hypothetical protein
MEKIKEKSWITQDDPVYFNKDLRYTLSPEAEAFFRKVSGNTPIRRELDRLMEAFSCLLANLHHAHAMDAPLIYSRNSNAYTIERKRYGYEFYTYKMVVRLVDALYAMGLLQGVKGRKTPTGRGLTSKMWATEELAGMFEAMGGSIFIKRNDEVLYLKDDCKRLQTYRESTLTRGLRRQIRGFNEMLGSLDMEFSFKPSDLSDNATSRLNKFKKLVSLSLCNQIKIMECCSSYIGSLSNTDSVSYTVIPDINTITTFHNTTTDTHTTKYYIDRKIIDNIVNNNSNIDYIGNVNKEANYMRRVFNVDWNHGGRFYKAPHITMPSACRQTMRINGEPTVEPDYSGQHVRMLYNLIGKDYRDECYVYAKVDKENKEERDRIKLASLIIINSGNRQEAIKAIHRQCWRKGIQYPESGLGKYSALVDAFEKYHSLIKQFLLSGKGLELQYLDSKIMANILDRMMKQNIPALPVHDSVICPARYENFLRQIMTEEYEKVMGYEPVIGD